MSYKPSRRHTRQRQVILEELQKLKTHPSATALYEIVRERLPNVSLGTVYRNLELLSSTGVIQKLNAGGREARFDGNADHHYHLCCSSCGRIDDVYDVPIDLEERGIKQLQGFEILGHQVQFIGVCPNCRSSETREAHQKLH